MPGRESVSKRLRMPTGDEPLYQRPKAYEHDYYPWHLRRVPESITVDGHSIDHPGRTSAIFVVHGIGDQAWTDTSALLRSGMEDALAAIRKWQHKHGEEIAAWQEKHGRQVVRMRT